MSSRLVSGDIDASAPLLAASSLNRRGAYLLRRDGVPAATRSQAALLLIPATGLMLDLQALSDIPCTACSHLCRLAGESATSLGLLLCSLTDATDAGSVAGCSTEQQLL